jgi:tetratricopeptide (TPR) repeat protein
MHTHHLCDGFGQLNRYEKSRSAKDKTRALQDAIGTLDYFLTRASLDYPLTPDGYLTRAQVRAYMQQNGVALTDALRALELNSKLVKAYTLAADLYVKAKHQDQALNLITQGLKRVPDSSVLKKAYDKLGGKPPYPEPESPSEPSLPPAIVPTPTDVPSKAAEPVAGPSEPARQNAEPSAVPIEPAPRPDSPSVVQPEAGEKRNPWCRFCP